MLELKDHQFCMCQYRWSNAVRNPRCPHAHVHWIPQEKFKIWLYKDKSTGQMKGDGTVTYEDPFSAGSAVQWFNGKEFKGAPRN